jgi:hypothetical protein
MRARKQLSQQADANGIGPLRRVYRTRNALASRLLGWVVIGGGLLATTAYFNVSPTLGYVVGAAVIVTYCYVVFFAGTSDPTGRRWFGVADGGLVVAHQYGSPDVVPWTHILGTQVRPANGVERTFELVAKRGDKMVPILIGEVSGGRRDLIRSITERRAIPPPTRLRALVGGAAAVAVLITAWLVFLPDFVATSESLPARVEDMSRACERAGAKFGDAAAFTGAGPHPIAVFVAGRRSYSMQGLATEPAVPGFSPNAPRDVQLVACVRRTGTGTSRFGNCTYRNTRNGDIRTVSMLQGVYTIDVYAARTHKKVATFQTVGDHTTCPASVTSDDDLYSSPTASILRDSLDKLVRGA